jgi:hypothetical protein
MQCAILAPLDLPSILRRIMQHIRQNEKGLRHAAAPFV